MIEVRDPLQADKMSGEPQLAIVARFLHCLHCTMSRPLKVLLSAYSCEPHRGSEPEVGWQWALQMARFHDVTVVTRTDNRPVIEPALEQLRGKRPLPAFVYYDLDETIVRLKNRYRIIRLYYVAWQRSVARLVEGLHARERYDLLHHVTFATYRYPTAIWGHGVPTVWGPVGGIETVPLALLPWRYPGGLIAELARNFDNFYNLATIGVLRHRGLASTMVLASTPEMKRVFNGLGIRAELFPSIGLNTADIPARPPSTPSGPLRLLYVGNLIALKGIDLALAALKRSGTDARLTLIGAGPLESAYRRLAVQLGLADRVEFKGRLPRQRTLEVYREHDVFLFPSLHDTGGLAVLEAMCAGLPAVCLDVAGPGALVREQCGVKVPLGSRGEVILGLAKAIKLYEGQRELLVEHGAKARELAISDYDWDRKGELMNRFYGSVFQSDRHDTGSNVAQSPPLCRTRSQQSKHNNHENDIAN
jgi:glycosyltransferase involved in cell wall biosynthesis